MTKRKLIGGSHIGKVIADWLETLCLFPNSYLSLQDSFNTQTMSGTEKGYTYTRLTQAEYRERVYLHPPNTDRINHNGIK